MLKLGASKHWHYALKQLTGEKTLNANALFDYFMPLKEYLESENQKINSNFM
jgi:peptidyl-dipeptidase A